MHRDPEAKYRLEAAAIAGHPPARYLLQRLCAEDETGGPNDDDDAACLDPGFRGTDPPIEDRDPDPAGLQEMVEELLPIAWSGDVAAQCCVGLAYRFGLGVGRDPEEAVRWFRLAADRGDGDACNHLGQMYCRGEGVGGPDHEAALWWFGAAAGRGDRRGLFNLAGMYHNGSGGSGPGEGHGVRSAGGRAWPSRGVGLGVVLRGRSERNEEKAISCLRAAAARGSKAQPGRLVRRWKSGPGTRRPGARRRRVGHLEAWNSEVLGAVRHRCATTSASGSSVEGVTSRTRSKRSSGATIG